MKHLLFLALLIPAIARAQPSNEELVSWTPKKLTWSDYKASPDPQSDAAASTTTYLGIEYNIHENHFEYKINSRFSKSRSWGLYKTEYILSHEQGHFDIAEIFARKLNKEMSEYVFDHRTFKQDLNRIYQDVLDEKERMQNDYDEETNHSINKEKQAQWLKRIKNMLEEYADWSNY